MPFFRPQLRLHSQGRFSTFLLIVRQGKVLFCKVRGLYWRGPVEVRAFPPFAKCAKDGTTSVCRLIEKADDGWEPSVLRCFSMTGIMLAHPSRKNKDAARVGHPVLLHPRKKEPPLRARSCGAGERRKWGFGFVGDQAAAPSNLARQASCRDGVTARCRRSSSDTGRSA
jgi:hypothetical protein